MTRGIRLAGAMVLVVLAGLLAPVAAAPSEQPDAANGDEPRTALEVIPDQGFRFTQTRTMGESTRDLSGVFSLDEARLNVTYGAADASQQQQANGTSAPRLDLSIAITGVFTFEDGNEDGRFDLGDRVLEHHRPVDSEDPRIEQVDPRRGFDRVVAEYPIEGGEEIRVTFLFPRFGNETAPSQAPTTGFGVQADVPDNLTRSSDATLIGVETRVLGQEVEVQGDDALAVHDDGTVARYTVLGTPRDGNGTPPLRPSLMTQRLEDPGHASAEEGILIEPTRANDDGQVALLTVTEREDRFGAAVLGAIQGEEEVYLVGAVLAAVLVGAGLVHRLEQEREA